MVALRCAMLRCVVVVIFVSGESIGCKVSLSARFRWACLCGGRCSGCFRMKEWRLLC